MTMLEPLGLISLISLILLLLIYILKPNFQQKMISSTFIWKLSLKYKKKKLPINKLRNILLIICQVLTLLGLTAVLVKPVKVIKVAIDNETIVILDTSASMRMVYDEETRFERAVDLLKQKVNETFNNEGIVSIVVADSNPYFLVERGNVNSRWEIEKQIDDFKADFKCSYGSTNLDSAVLLCQDILVDNPNANIFIYTDIEVAYLEDGFTIVDCKEVGENNVAILSAYAEVIDNYYSFVVDLASYGTDENVELKLSVYGANKTEDDNVGYNYDFTDSIDLNSDQTKRIIFINSDIDISGYPEDENIYYYQIPDTDKIFSYESIQLNIDADDSFEEDNRFSIYGGQKEIINMVYASSSINPFVSGILFVLQSALSDRFEVHITEAKNGTVPYSGYDIYIYEHTMMPIEAPTDGLAIYIDPQATVASAGFSPYQYINITKDFLTLTEEEPHELIKNMVADDITVTKFIKLSSYDPSYHTLMSVDNNPAIMFRDEGNYKSLVLLLDLHYSNLPILPEFPVLMFNAIEYFFPRTIEGNMYEVSDKLTVKTRSDEIIIQGNDDTIILTEFPTSIVLDLPGTYTVSQTTHFNKSLEEMIYVNIPAEESNVFPMVDTIANPIPVVTAEDYFQDLLFWFAVGLSGLVFVEWLLKGKESI